jgi:hypothetical protein
MDAELSLMVASFYDRPTYEEAERVIETSFMQRGGFRVNNVPLCDAGGRLDEAEWLAISEPIQQAGLPWRVCIFRQVTAFGIDQRVVPLTFMRLVPPPAVKADLTELGAQCTSMLVSDEFLEVKLDVMNLLNISLFPDNKYFFFPTLNAWALVPHFDHDLVVAYLGAKGLFG